MRPGIQTYHYISLEGNPEARVIERAQATPGEHRFFIGEIPTRYKIEREGYTLTLVVHPASWSTGIAVFIHPYPERHIGFHDKADRVPGRCVKWQTYNHSVSWLYNFHICGGKSPWKWIDNQLRFTVFDQNGAVVAEESIPYTVERNGFYGYMDAI